MQVYEYEPCSTTTTDTELKRLERKMYVDLHTS